ncbi:PREDICTED: uncharacterized protein LOC108366349 [Rhagoletis zephyria]|uniref:uncharacterized protein LOC108366349 n=1 Tax=Rhagoletis zephyria TaxID=28612 RepID=UPI0008112273|nr:PREDICTED: uncharacterized protein LOC108366349 [Rhagoletis zephyria]
MSLEQGKMYKKTTNEQFDILSREMERNVQIARGAPVFGGSRAQFEEKWEQISLKLNSAGPPHRSVKEWKKVWTDIRNRTKKKISKNNSLLRETGGGPFNECSLTPLERTVDKIVNLSKSAAPCGLDFGVGLSDNAVQLSSSPSPSPPLTTHPSSTEIPRAQIEENARPTTSLLLGSNSTSAPQPAQPIVSGRRKRKRNDLLEQQVENQNMLLDVLKSHVEMTRRMAEAVERQAVASEKLCRLIEERSQIVLPF